MNIRVAGIVFGAALAASTALAQQSSPAKPIAAAATAAAQKSPAKRAAAQNPTSAANSTTAQPTEDPTGAVKRRKGKAAGKVARAAAVPAGYAALPEDERLAIQSDLAWLGDFDPTTAKDADERTIAAIKGFQKRHGGKQTGVLSADERSALAAAAAGPQKTVGWRIVDDTNTGAQLGLPMKLVGQSSPARTGSRWTSPHDQIEVETMRLHEAALPVLFDHEKTTPRSRRVDYGELKSDSFVISGMQRLKYFLVRVEAHGAELRGVTVLYDQATAGIMAPVALAIANTFRGFPEADAAPFSGGEQGVEYATAIVVSGRGDLLTLGQVTNQCQSITVPGLGHAERVARDKATDLTLLRLYGAQSLNPASLAGTGGVDNDLTLVGIADPTAQAGGDAVTSTPAHVTAQGIEPVPRLGFSGAAAVDARGRFAGVVELKSPVVAGIGAHSLVAELVPATAVRAFLTAQGVAVANGHAAMDQSVVRVICVRQ